MTREEELARRGRKRPLLERLVIAWRVARGRPALAGMGAARGSSRGAGGGRSDDGGPGRRRGYSVIPELLDDFAERAGEGGVELPPGAVETGGDRPGAISHAETFDAPRPPRVSPAPAPMPAPMPAPGPQHPVIYYQGQVYNRRNFPAYFR